MKAVEMSLEVGCFMVLALASTNTSHKSSGHNSIILLECRCLKFETLQPQGFLLMIGLWDPPT